MRIQVSMQLNLLRKLILLRPNTIDEPLLGPANTSQALTQTLGNTTKVRKGNLNASNTSNMTNSSGSQSRRRILMESDVSKLHAGSYPSLLRKRRPSKSDCFIDASSFSIMHLNDLASAFKGATLDMLKNTYDRVFGLESLQTICEYGKTAFKFALAASFGQGMISSKALSKLTDIEDLSLKDAVEMLIRYLLRSAREDKSIPKLALLKLLILIKGYL
jgi:hypothetical protein